MNQTELDKLLLDIRELKKSVHKANPFLREIMALRAYSIMSVPLGVILLADSLAMHFLIRAHGSFAAIPTLWKVVGLAIFALIAVIGSATKWIVIDRRASELRAGANFMSVIEAMYGGNWFSISASHVLCMVVTSVFSVYIGHPWLIIAFIAIFLGPFCNTVAKVLDRKEYLYTGWFLIISGLASLFFLESAPFIWLAIVWAGTFLIFGFSGLSATKPTGDRAEERP